MAAWQEGRNARQEGRKAGTQGRKAGRQKAGQEGRGRRQKLQDKAEGKGRMPYTFTLLLSCFASLRSCLSAVCPSALSLSTVTARFARSSTCSWKMSGRA